MDCTIKMGLKTETSKVKKKNKNKNEMKNKKKSLQRMDSNNET